MWIQSHLPLDLGSFQAVEISKEEATELARDAKSRVRNPETALLLSHALGVSVASVGDGELPPIGDETILCVVPSIAGDPMDYIRHGWPVKVHCFVVRRC